MEILHVILSKQLLFMRSGILLTILFIFLSNLTVSSQTIYHFEYNLHHSTDSKDYEAFFVRYTNGSGFIRLKYKEPGIEKFRIVEMNIQEQFFSYSDGTSDTNRIFYKATEPVFIPVETGGRFTAPVFWFLNDPEKGIFEPTAVTAAENDTVMNPLTIFKAVFLKREDLKSDFVKKFFTVKDDFYTNLFGIRSRGLSEDEKKIKIHLLVVANSNDPSIGDACYKDMNRMVETFGDLADFLSVGMDTATISGNRYTKTNIENAIKELDPGPEDIVVFYYSGHGFRKKKDSRRFPYLDFREKPGDDYLIQSANIEDIFVAIRKKGARFNLVFSDCCNNDPDSTNAIGTPVPKSRGAGLDWNIDNCRALFMNPQRESILATAADKWQLASCNNNFGGFFSYFFKSSMETHFSVFKKNVSWETVMQEAIKQTVFKANHTYCSKPPIGKPYGPENICRQVPVYTISRK